MAGGVGFEDIWRGRPTTEVVDLRGSAVIVMTVPLSRAPDARWIHLFNQGIGVDAAAATKAPPIAGDAVIVETTETEAGRALRVLDARIEAANRSYRLGVALDVDVDVTAPAVARGGGSAETPEVQLDVLDRLLGA